MPYIAKKHILSALITLFLTPVAAAQLNYTTPQGRTVTVTALTPNVLRVENQAQVAPKAWGASAIDQQRDPQARITQTSLTTSAGVKAWIDNGTLYLQGPNIASRIADNGCREAMADTLTAITLQPAAQGSYYGAGERGHRLNLAGDTLVMYNRANYGYTGSDPRLSQTNITMPLVLSNNGYALVFDDPGAATLALGPQITYTTESPTPLTYYYVASDGSMASLVQNLSELTGRQDLPPLWALGYITSKYGYKTQDEALDAVDSLKALGYPLDGIVLDLYWYGKEEDMGRLAWDPQQFPDPAYMNQYLQRKGVNSVAISQPFVLQNGRGLDNYNLLDAEGLLLKDTAGRTAPVEIWVGHGGMFDVSNPATRQWLAQRYDSLATTTGISGWWGDLGEPEKHPTYGRHANGLTSRQYHNKYGNDWAKIIHDLYTEKFPDTRLMTLMRAGTTGLQRYSVFPWTGDVSRSWGGLEPQIRLMLNSGLSGLGYMGHDVGGFAVDPSAPVDPELYVRWLQLGLFTPMLRTHAQENAEPYHYPQHQAIIKKLISERYRWLPYNYNLAYENATKGWPLVRTLDFHSPQPVGKYDNLYHQFLWGKDILVAPVVEQGATSKQVVFPEGNDSWLDITSPRTAYAPGSTIQYPALLEVLPLFVREGAFIPMANYPMKSTQNYRPNNYQIDFYPGKTTQAEGYIFEDDLHTPTAKTHNAGRLITMKAQSVENGKYLDVTLDSQGTYPGASSDKTITFAFRGLAKEPRWIEVDGKNARVTWDKETGTAQVAFVFHLGRPLTIRLKY